MRVSDIDRDGLNGFRATQNGMVDTGADPGVERESSTLAWVRHAVERLERSPSGRCRLQPSRRFARTLNAFANCSLTSARQMRAISGIQALRLCRAVLHAASGFGRVGQNGKPRRASSSVSGAGVRASTTAAPLGALHRGRLRACRVHDGGIASAEDIVAARRRRVPIVAAQRKAAVGIAKD